MDGRGIFRGNFLQAIDAKGRIAIPSNLRATLERNSSDKTLVVSMHEESGCLVGYDPALSPILQDRLRREAEAAGRADASRHNINRATFGLTEDVGYDSSGRFVLPGFFRKKAQLTDWAYFVGAGDFFEIWSPAVALADDALLPDIKDRIRYDLEERGVTLP